MWGKNLVLAGALALSSCTLEGRLDYETRTTAAYARGSQASHMGDDKALAHFDDAIIISSDWIRREPSAAAYWNRAQARHAKFVYLVASGAINDKLVYEQLELSLADARSSLNYDPNQPDCHAQLGQGNIILKRPEDARKHFKEALRLLKNGAKATIFSEDRIEQRLKELPKPIGEFY